MVIGITLLSVLVVSLLSLIGILTISWKEKTLHKVIIYLVSFAAGALFGDAFIHLLPEAVEDIGFTMQLSLVLLSGIVLFFIIEKFIHWHHCHHAHLHANVASEHTSHPHSFAYMNLVGDVVHNFIDGLIIAGSYLVSIPLGFATTIAVILHEIPQEISDFGVLMHGGFTKKKALFFNFLTALTAFIGAGVALILGNIMEGFGIYLLAFTAGGFIYIAGSDLIPELHKHFETKKSFIQLITFLLGIGLMVLLVMVE